MQGGGESATGNAQARGWHDGSLSLQYRAWPQER